MEAVVEAVVEVVVEVVVETGVDCCWLLLLIMDIVILTVSKENHKHFSCSVVTLSFLLWTKLRKNRTKIAFFYNNLIEIINNLR